MLKLSPAKIKGRLIAPPSKSLMQRAVFAAALARGQSELLNPSFADDCLAALDVARALGAKVERSPDRVGIQAGATACQPVLQCRESGLCLRLSCAIAALFDQAFTITGSGSLLKRPIQMVKQSLQQLGVSIQTSSGLPPVTIRGPLRGGKVEVDGSISSQFVSGLLMALPLCQEDSEVSVSDLKSKPYIQMTLQLLKAFGLDIETAPGLDLFRIRGGQKYQARTYSIEGDWSGAACLLVAGAIAGEMEISGLEIDSLQADRAILTALKKSGAAVAYGASGIKVSSASLSGFEFDAGDCPDLFPALIALACNCRGASVFWGAKRLIHKESNRAQALLQEFKKLGAQIVWDDDRMQVNGGRLQGGGVNCHNDHRIAMACAVASLTSSNGITLDEPQVVAKSYPRFFEDLQSVMVNL